MTQEERKKILDQFVKEFMLAEPYKRYVNGCGFTSRTMIEWSKGGGRVSPAKVSKRLREKNIDPSEVYLNVFLREDLPEGMEIPEVYLGLKTFVQVVGTFRAY